MWDWIYAQHKTHPVWRSEVNAVCDVWDAAWKAAEQNMPNIALTGAASSPRTVERRCSPGGTDE